MCKPKLACFKPSQHWTKFVQETYVHDGVKVQKSGRDCVSMGSRKKYMNDRWVCASLIKCWSQETIWQTWREHNHEKIFVTAHECDGAQDFLEF